MSNGHMTRCSSAIREESRARPWLCPWLWRAPGRRLPSSRPAAAAAGLAPSPQPALPDLCRPTAGRTPSLPQRTAAAVSSQPAAAAPLRRAALPCDVDLQLHIEAHVTMQAHRQYPLQSMTIDPSTWRHQTITDDDASLPDIWPEAAPTADALAAVVHAGCGRLCCVRCVIA
jgi:hypothetical protein